MTQGMRLYLFWYILIALCSHEGMAACRDRVFICSACAPALTHCVGAPAQRGVSIPVVPPRSSLL